MKEEINIDKKKRGKVWGCGFTTGMFIGLGVALIEFGYSIRSLFGHIGTAPGSDLIIYGLVLVLIGSVFGIYSYFKYVKSS
jgi:hypothetical protein